MTTTLEILTAAINESIRTNSRVHCTIEARNADDVRDLCYTAWADMLAEQGDEAAELDCDVEVLWDEETEEYSVCGWAESTTIEQEWLLLVETEEPASALAIGDRVCGGEGEDYDEGTVQAIDGHMARVSWDSCVETDAPARGLRRL